MGDIKSFADALKAGPPEPGAAERRFLTQRIMADPKWFNHAEYGPLVNAVIQEMAGDEPETVILKADDETITEIRGLRDLKL